MAGGVTILLTTQYLDEADELADAVAVLDNGSIVATGTPDELKRRVPGGHVRLVFPEPESLRVAALALGMSTSDDETRALQVPVDGSVPAVRAVLDRLDAERIAVDTLTVHSSDLDDVFLSLTGHPTEAPMETLR